MNIAFLLRLWPVFGGGETVTLTLANEFVKRGHNVTIIYFKDHRRAEMPFIDPRIKSILIPDSGCDEVRAALKNKEYIAGELEKILLENNIHIAINQWWPVEFTRNINKKTPVKLIKCHHTAIFREDAIEGSGFKNTFKKLKAPLSLYFRKKDRIKQINSYIREYDKFIFLSPAFVEQYFELTGSKKYANKLSAISNPLVYDQFLSPDELITKEKEVLFVGRLHELTKRMSRILKSWKIVQDSNRFPDWKLTIIGDGPDKGFYEQTAKELGLCNYSFKGSQNPLPYYKRSSIFTLTSDLEGFGMVLTEALQNGVVPVVMDTFPSLGDILENNINGIVLPDKNVEDYASALMDLMDNNNKRIALARNGLVTCRKFAIDKIADEWESLFSSIP